ncbi:hypothetical protein BGZ47_006810 [Haplosporangium gracile]|nr:hypothetical protein BGZ47_006810 [Haplosporangium gracile]
MDTLPDLCQRHIAQCLPLASITPLLFINKHWFHFTATLLYRNPFNTLKQTCLRNFIDGDDFRERLYDLIYLLLSCCNQQYLISDTVQYKSRRFATPIIDYLQLYTHQTNQAIEYLSREWRIPPADRRTDRYDLIRIAFATHKPEYISHLYMPMYYLNQLIHQTPQPRFTRLQRLEIYDDHAVPETKQLYSFFAELQSMTPTSQYELSELALTIPTWELRAEERVKPLDLTHWSCLRRLDLLSWQAEVDWGSLPIANLNDLRLNLAMMSKGFDPAIFFGFCNKLQTLYVHGVSNTTFSWVQQQPPSTAMPMLSTLEIGGARIPLMLSLTFLLEACSTNVETLAIVLQEDGATPYIPENIHWTKDLPKLHSLLLKNKAVFEFNPAAMEYCPILRHLTLGIDAEKADPGCTEVMSPRFEKWCALLDTMKLVGRYGRHLESMRFDGCWIFGGRVALLATEPMKCLKSLYLSPGIRSVNSTVVCSLLRNMDGLTLLEVPVEPADWNHSDELADLLEARPNLEVRPTNFSVRF